MVAPGDEEYERSSMLCHLCFADLAWHYWDNDMVYRLGATKEYGALRLLLQPV